MLVATKTQIAKGTAHLETGCCVTNCFALVVSVLFAVKLQRRATQEKTGGSGS